MTTNSILLQNVDENRLKEIVSEAIREQFSVKPKEEKYLSRKEVKEKLGICLPTLDKAIAQGVLKSYRIGGRILLRDSELNLSEIPIRKRR